MLDPWRVFRTRASPFPPPPSPCLVPGGLPGPEGVPPPGELVSGGDPQMATADGGTHPTGMHSCSENVHVFRFPLFRTDKIPLTFLVFFAIFPVFF